MSKENVGDKPAELDSCDVALNLDQDSLHDFISVLEKHYTRYEQYGIGPKGAETFSRLVGY